ncbi:hypothetical protein CDD83_6621 [Cordyceps sp. RAO-2017]|nr:hypothetical protein CDD83_6621 [Cordyceps sp. RAO-2017]
MKRNLVFSLAAWPLAGAVPPAPTTTSPPPTGIDRFLPLLEDNAPGQFVYVGVPMRGTTAPAHFRARGGIVFGDGPHADAAYAQVSLPEDSVWVWVERDLEAAAGRSSWRAADGHIFLRNDPAVLRWVFRASAVPTMVTRNGAVRHLHALGGIPWTAVQAWCLTTGDPDRRAYEWQLNDDWDARWSRFGPGGELPPLNHVVPPRGLSSRQLARDFVNALLSDRNGLYSADRRRDLRQLYDWNPDLEPDRDFPLIRRRQAESLVSLTLRHFPWFNISGMAPHVQHMLAGGLPTAWQCLEGIWAVRSWTSGRPQRRRERGGVEEEEACHRLAAQLPRPPLDEDETPAPPVPHIDCRGAINQKLELYAATDPSDTSRRQSIEEELRRDLDSVCAADPGESRGDRSGVEATDQELRPQIAG